MPKDWWKSFFDQNYLEFQETAGTFKHTKKEVNFLVKNLPLKKNHKVLDLCCGHGRHSLELAHRGYSVTGLDYSNYELEIARKLAVKKGLKIKLRQGDARNFRFAQKFDVIINMFTAFGHGSEEDDEDIIKSVSRNVKRRGKFFIDLRNLAWLWRNYRAKDKLIFKNSMRVEMARRFDFLTGINHEKRRIYTKKGNKLYESSLRMYSLKEIAGLLSRHGLKVENYWGSYDGHPLGLDTKRMLVLAQKI
ncbi:MAG: class I SAM-dependent methyltransferase [Candidatus Doudnabacteria bacterium]|nr:class I SAM-dependent methyltransferase [Candidatus Doudnabacteria bacterium]